MADLTVRYIGDVKKLQSASKQAEGIVGKFHTKVTGLGKSIAAGVFGGNLVTGGAQKLIGVVGDVIDQAREAEKVTKLTNAAIKSTGGVAKVSAGQVADLADSLSLKTGIDDEQIQSNENLLLTFTNIRNEVGKGNDIFNQATATIQDMSVALGQDSASSSIQLGKALNDPIKGITALTRVGVSFTQQQKDQIAWLVKSGNRLGAQKIILKELGKEFGGAAAAAATPMDRLKVTIGNLEENLGKKLLPTIDKVAAFLSDELPGALDKTGQAFSDFGEVIKDILDKAQPLFEVLGPLFKQAFEGIKKLLDDVGAAFGTDGGTILKVIAGIIVAFGLLSIAWALVPGLIIAGILALYNRFQFLRTGVTVTIKAIVAIVKAFAIALKTTFDAIVTVITGLWDRFGDDLTTLTKGAFAAISQIVRGAMEFIRGVIRTFTALFRGDWSGAWDGMKQIVAGAANVIVGIVRGLGAAVRATLAVAWQQVRGGVESAWGGIINYFQSVPGRIVGAFSGIAGGLYNVGAGIAEGFWNGFRAAWNNLAERFGTIHLPKVHIPGTSIDIGGGSITVVPSLAQGGIVAGPTSGYLAMLHGREQVTPLNGPHARTAAVTNVTINVSGIGDRELGRQVVQALREYQRTKGPINLKIAG